MEKSYRNIAYLFIALLLITFIGFFKSYVALFPHFTGITNAHHFHGFMLLLWVLLLIAQPLLIRRKKIELHRLLGKFSYFLMPIMVLSIFMVAQVQYQRGLLQGLPYPELYFGMYMTFADVVPFVTLYVLAMWFRRKTHLHTRLIIACSVIFFNPALGRILIFYLGVPFIAGILLAYLLCDLIVLSFLIYDLRLGKSYRPYLYSLLFLAFWHTSFFYVPQSVAWQKMAAAFANTLF